MLIELAGTEMIDHRGNHLARWNNRQRIDDAEAAADLEQRN